MTPRVLLIGGHGKVSLLLTPLLLARSWHVTSLIRDSSQSDDILSRGKGQPGRVDVLVRSLEEVKSDSDAQKVLDEVKPDYVVWSAGAGGKGGSGRTYAIDRDAAKHFISSAVATSSISKFLMISYVGSRRNRPPWWNEEEWASCQKVNTEVLPHYYAAKVEADERLAALSKNRHHGFQAICLRPGNLTDDAATGKVSLGHTTARGKVSRADVADVAARLLERNDTRGWYDLLSGDEDVEKAVERVVREKAPAKIDCDVQQRPYERAHDHEIAPILVHADGFMVAYIDPLPPRTPFHYILSEQTQNPTIDSPQRTDTPFNTTLSTCPLRTQTRVLTQPHELESPPILPSPLSHTPLQVLTLRQPTTPPPALHDHPPSPTTPRTQHPVPTATTPLPFIPTQPTPHQRILSLILDSSRRQAHPTYPPPSRCRDRRRSAFANLIHASRRQQRRILGEGGCRRIALWGGRVG